MPEKTRKFRKKTAPIGEILQLGHVQDGELLRYKNKSKDLLMVGRARSDGIECYERPGVSYTQFEQMAGSKLHRPCEHIMALNGKTLQQIIGEIRAQQLQYDIPDERRDYHLVAKLDRNPFWNKKDATKSAQALKKLCSLCGVHSREGGLILCRRCPAAYHPTCASTVSVLPSPDWACPACTCSICCGSHFASHTHLRLPACFIDTVPTGRPKNTCTIELPAEGYVSLEWVQAVMETRSLVKDILMEEAKKGDVAGGSGGTGKIAETGNVGSHHALLEELLGLARDCTELEQIRSKVDEKFAEGQGTSVMSDSLENLCKFLFPAEEAKDREQMLIMVSKHLLDLATSNGSKPKANSLEGGNIKSSPPAWRGIPLKRRKIQPDSLKPPNRCPDQSAQEGFPIARNGVPQMPKGFPGRHPMQWYQMNRGAGFRGFPQGLPPMGSSEVRNAVEQMTRHMMGAMGAMGRFGMFPGMGGGFPQENGMPGWFNRKWRPRGSPANGAKDPRFCSIQPPLLIPENDKEGEKEAEEKELNLFVTGTNGTATCEAVQSKIDANFDAVAELMDPEILRQAGVEVDKVDAEFGSKDMELVELVDVPRFDLGAYLAEYEAQSDHTMSSGSGSSVDVDMRDEVDGLGSCGIVVHDSDCKIAAEDDQQEDGVLESNCSEGMVAPLINASNEPGCSGEPSGQKEGGTEDQPGNEGVGRPGMECSGKPREDCDAAEARWDANTGAETRHASNEQDRPVDVDCIVDVVMADACNKPVVDDRGGNGEGCEAEMELDDVDHGCMKCSNVENVEAECNRGAGQASAPPDNRNNPGDGCEGANAPQTTGKNGGNGKSSPRCLSEIAKSGKGSKSKSQTECSSQPAAPSDSATVTDNGLGVAGGDECEETQQPRELQGFDQSLEVCCAQCNRRCHLGCLSPNQIRSWAPWFCCQGCHDVSWSLAEVNCRGLIQIDRLVDNTPVSWQLIRGAAVVDSNTCQGYAPRYKTSQRKQLKQVLNVICDVMQASQVLDNDMLASLIQGRASPDSRRDFSNFHTAVLWVGATLVGACQVRVLGQPLAEITYFEIRPEFRRSGLGKHLLGALEKRLLELGVERLVMPSIKNVEHMGGLRKTDGWPAAMGYIESSVSEFSEFNTFGLVHVPGFPFAMKTCKMENLVQFEMYCKRPPVRRERLLQAMVELKRSKTGKKKIGAHTDKSSLSQEEPSKYRDSQQPEKSDRGSAGTSKTLKGEDAMLVAQIESPPQDGPNTSVIDSKEDSTIKKR
ncbi:hypothetical protein BSKO_06634 [Bryopsis sp. KO-2023]|nr:hypothetical protein BSKO_06634 [Bryopsis sp. KO-2023]